MVAKLFSNKPDPEVQALLSALVPPEVPAPSQEALAQAATPRGRGMLELLGFGAYSWTDILMGQGDLNATRHGRQVSCAFGMTGMGKPTVTTHVALAAPPFAVSHKDKDWEGMGLPPGVVEGLRRFGPLDKDVSVEGGPQGISVQRKRSSKDAASQKGTLQWLNDLRLAESLADALAG